MFLRETQVICRQVLCRTRPHIPRQSAYFSSGYLHNSKIPTYHFQESLPKIPIPPLEESIKRYLASAEPIIHSEEAFLKTKAIAEDFLENEGKTLHDQLVARDSTQYTSYYNEFWGNMYLEDNNTLLRHTPYIGWENDPSPNKNTQLARATNLIVSSVSYFRTLRDEKMNPVVFHTKPKITKTSWWETMIRFVPRKVAAYVAIAGGAYPLDMTNMKKMFHATRIPGMGLDTLRSFPDSKHILVQRGTNFYTVDVLDDKGDQLPDENIASSIAAILAEPLCVDGPSIGALTLWEREKWCEARNKLLQLGDNEDIFAQVDSALFAVCLEHNVVEKESDQLNKMLFGELSTNRWHDKSFQVFVRPDGVSGITFEHSWGDGVAVLSYLTEVYDHAVKSPSIKPADTLPPVKQLVWTTDKDVEASSQSAKQFVEKFLLSIDGPAICKRCEAIGSSWAKENKLSPDAVIQMAFQLGYFKMHHASASTYEAATTGLFKHGRTETIRSCSSFSEKMCSVYADPHSSKQDRRNALEAAVKHHSKLANDAQRGNGWDRHLFALQKLALQNGGPLPAFYKDETYKALSKIILSTSTLGNIPQLALGGFNPVSTDCYAIGYGVEKDCMQWMVSSHGRDSQSLSRAIEEAVNEFKAAFE